ncbi:MAG: MurR/RpiR family transcriptional regulator [Gluconacetobacter liquefaciens]
MPSSSISFVKRILNAINDLPDAERRLAEFILDFPGDLASYEARELAGYAGVSNATVSRLVRRLGYTDFSAARHSVRSEKTLGSPLMLDAKQRDQPDTIAAGLAYSHASLDATFAALSDQALNDVVQWISRARMVWIAGYRSNQAFAAYFRWQIYQFLPLCQLIPGPGETIAEHMAHFEKDDCLVVFGVRRRVRQVDLLLEHARQTGMKTVLITDHLYGETKTVDRVLRCDTKGPGALDSHVAVAAVCSLLITRLFHASGAHGRRRLVAMEAAHEQADELAQN